MRGVAFILKMRLLSIAAYRLNLIISLASAMVGALSYFANASFRDVVIEGYGVPFTSYAVAGAVAAALTVVNPIYLTPYDLTLVGLRSRVAGEVLHSMIFGAVKAVPILILGYPYLRPLPSFMALLPLLAAMEFAIGILLSTSELLLGYENVISWVYYGLWNLVSGLWFPVKALPTPLDSISVLLPQYHLISLIRDPLIGRFPLESILYASLFLPVSILIANRMLHMALSRGAVLVRD